MEPVPNRASAAYTPEQSAWLEEAHKFTNKMTSKAKVSQNFEPLMELTNRGAGLFGDAVKASDHLLKYKNSRKKN